MQRLLSRRKILGAAAALAAGGAAAQSYPNRPIRILVPFPAGGPTDVVARHIGNDWQNRLGWRNVVENKGGASGYIGHEEVRRTAPDGYTLMPLVTPAVLNYRFMNKSFALPSEFTPIGMVYTQYIVMLVNPAVKEMADVKTLKDLFTLAKATPNKLSYTSAGNGSMGHLTTSLLANLSGASMVHVPYRGDAPAMNDVLAGTVPVMFASSTTALPHVRSGKLRAIAVSSSARSPELPDVPTIIESGFPGVIAMPWNGMVGPPGMPADLVARLSQALKESLATADIQQKFQAASLTPTYLPPKEFTEWVNKDFAVWSKVITDNNIQVTA